MLGGAGGNAEFRVRVPRSGRPAGRPAGWLAGLAAPAPRRPGLAGLAQPARPISLALQPL